MLSFLDTGLCGPKETCHIKFLCLAASQLKARCNTERQGNLPLPSLPFPTTRSVSSKLGKGERVGMRHCWGPLGRSPALQPLGFGVLQIRTDWHPTFWLDPWRRSHPPQHPPHHGRCRKGLSRWGGPASWILCLPPQGSGNSMIIFLCGVRCNGLWGVMGRSRKVVVV